jgi:hypothetical protein
MLRMLNLLITVIIISCSPQKQGDDISKQKIEVSSKYPAIIDSMGLQSEYDTAKWNLYCIYCDDTVKLRKSKKDSAITFGSLELKFAGVEKKSDSVEMSFYFYIDSIRCDLESIVSFGDKFFANGVLFIKDSLTFYTTPTTMRYFRQGGIDNRFFKPLQPDVIAFINNNKDKLSQWFRKEAIRRKIIE